MCGAVITAFSQSPNRGHYEGGHEAQENESTIEQAQQRWGLSSLSVPNQVNPMAHGVATTDVVFDINNLIPLKMTNANAVINPAFSQVFTGMMPRFPVELLSDGTVPPTQLLG